MRAVLIVALAAFAVACGGEAAADTLPAKLEYSRSGGIAGVSVLARIQPDGRGKFATERGRARSARLTKAERDRIARLVRAADLAHVKVNGKNECCDQFEYRISYRGRTLIWSDAHFPAKLSKLVGALEKLVDKYGGGPG